VVAARVRAVLDVVKGAVPDDRKVCRECGATGAELAIVRGKVDRVCGGCAERLEQEAREVQSAYAARPLNLPLGLALWVPLALVAELHILSVAPTAAEALIAAAWLGTAGRRRHAALRAFREHKYIPLLFIALIVWMALSLLWADDPGQAWSPLSAWLQAGALLVVIGTTLEDSKHVRWLVLAYIAGCTLSTALGLVPSLDTVKEGRLQGGAPDADTFAAMVAPAMALAAGYFALARGAGMRLLVCIGGAVAAIGVSASQSRGGVVAVGGMLLAAIVVYRRQRWAVLGFVALLATVAGVWFTASPAAWQRVTHFNDGGTGRTDLWHVAWREANDHPILGVGLGNFHVKSLRYVRRPGALKRVDVIDRHAVTHNTYLGMLAECGLIGFLLLVAVIIACLRAALLAASRFDLAGEGRMAALARAVFVGSIG